MAVITFSRELGSEGDYIAEKVAQSLGYHFIEKEFIGTVLSEYGLVEFDKEYDNLPSFWEKFTVQKAGRREEMVSMLNRVILALASHGNVVIQGRSGFVILGSYADVLNVRIQAPLENRVKRVMKREEISVERAEEKIKYGDKVRSAFVKTFYGVQWETSKSFDLLINTSKVEPEVAVKWLVEAAKAVELKEDDEKSTTASIKVDSTLAKVVSEELECKVTHKK